MREAMRETVKRYSLWYLLQGVLMVLAGVLALIYPLLASVAMVYLLGSNLPLPEGLAGSGSGERSKTVTAKVVIAEAEGAEVEPWDGIRDAFGTLFSADFARTS